MQELKKVKLDELELYLNQIEQDYKKELENKTYLEIANLIQVNFNVQCTEQDINLLYDPKLEDLINDNEYYYSQVLQMGKNIDQMYEEIKNE